MNQSFSLKVVKIHCQHHSFCFRTEAKRQRMKDNREDEGTEKISLNMGCDKKDEEQEEEKEGTELNIENMEMMP